MVQNYFFIGLIFKIAKNYSVDWWKFSFRSCICFSINSVIENHCNKNSEKILSPPRFCFSLDFKAVRNYSVESWIISIRTFYVLLYDSTRLRYKKKCFPRDQTGPVGRPARHAPNSRHKWIATSNWPIQHVRSKSSQKTYPRENRNHLLLFFRNVLDTHSVIETPCNKTLMFHFLFIEHFSRICIFNFGDYILILSIYTVKLNNYIV